VFRDLALKCKVPEREPVPWFVGVRQSVHDNHNAAAANAATTDSRTVPATTDVRLANRYAASLCS
jgi:hypothetical protein